MRLSSLSVRGVAGLPDVDFELQPMTALIGPRASGKSRLLAAISWLLTGQPDLAAESGPSPDVSAHFESRDGGKPASRRIRRNDGSEPEGPLPSVTYLSARARLSSSGESSPYGSSDAALAEAVVAEIAERRLAGAQNEVLLIEEPELMLTPQQQRHFYKLLRRYSERNQVIYSTRAPALLEAINYPEIVRLDLSPSGMAVRRAPPGLLTDEQRVRLEAEFDHERNEMFFATAVVLTEGQTERLSLPLIFSRLGHDPDALGISIVEVGGKGNLVLYSRVLNELRIPHVIVHDSDRGRGDKRENSVIRESVGKAPVFVLDPDFEAVAGIHDRDDKVLAAWRRFSAIDAERIPRVFHEIADATVDLANGSEGG
ncbi:MAG TPA: TOPRIM nucleotidyl transferase/hydrolase domain-containing protein [Candidatus Limnocylindrales bacterium]|nr:TOPRIM nucleotidyl transferase/hydrolase domain-containing protein [Candidatus Limnocylindrales bacterium]